ncbi:MAG: hypothetical protein ABI550_02815 [Ignavibacteriaceae bacterium]
MIEIKESISVKYPSAKMFQFISNYRNDILWREIVDKIEAPPMGEIRVGTKTNDIINFLGKKFLTESEVKEFHPERKIALQNFDDEIKVFSSREVHDKGEETEFHYYLKVEPKKINRFILPLLKSSLTKQVKKDLQKLKSVMQKMPENQIAL